MNVHSMRDLKKREEEKEKSQGFFAGGAKSGLSVRAPDSGPKVGSDEVKIKVTIWANGFQVDDGPLREMEAPEGRQFMAALQRNRLPDELLSKTKGKRPVLTIENKRGEVYEEQRRARYTPFEGSGQRVSSGQIATPAGTVNLDVPPPYMNPKYPQVTVQVNFHDGKKKEIAVNETTRVAAIREFVMTAAPVAGDFDLMTDYPPVPLRNFKLTVQEANIANSSVRQKLL